MESNSDRGFSRGVQNNSEPVRVKSRYGELSTWRKNRHTTVRGGFFSVSGDADHKLSHKLRCSTLKKAKTALLDYKIADLDLKPSEGRIVKI
jgi:hypothetical protein